MMIPAVDIILSMRYALGDMQGLNISDYQLIEPINQAVSKLYGYLSQRYVHAVIAEKGPIWINPDDTTDDYKDNPRSEYMLPETFLRIHQILGAPFKVKKNEDGSETLQDPNDEDYRVMVPTSGRILVRGMYRIIGRTLRVPKGVYIIEYYYIPARIETPGEEIDVPESMRTWVEQVALAMYKKDYATADALIMQCEAELTGREVSHFENTGPAQVLGGRV